MGVSRQRFSGLLGVCLALSLSSAACGGSDDAVSTSLATTTDVPATTSPQTTTEAAATTTEAATTTTEAGPDFPTFDEFIASLPPGTETCDSRGEVTDEGGGIFMLGGSDAAFSMQNGQLVIFCPGAKLVVGEPFTGVNQFGDPLETGALFTADPDGNFVQLSSF